LFSHEHGGGFYIGTAKMHEGVIAALRLDKGFGFIGEPNSPDVFFHMSDTIDLEWNEQLEGRRVCFDVVTTPKGTRARNVRAAD
jgi:cold shock CspA family protein